MGCWERSWTHESMSGIISCIMCRNIKTLFNFQPPVTDDEIRAASLQFVRKVSGFHTPSKTNEPAFLAAIDEIEAASRRLLDALQTNAPARNREEEAAKAKSRAALRFSRVNEIDGRNHAEVLIVGAGPTGLVLALWLTRFGVRVRIIDKLAASGTTSRALAVQGRTLEFYQQFGFARAVIDRGHKVAGVNLWVKGKPAARIPLA